ncbi:hypothetical protein E2C01_098735 [Portunus trituberculatus]|uniref:Uncharacterized protein n=1 Tax=Portunus trituberculatus TaxID=210409 RepID=A0A5B7KEX1_PORTR|nr:hypothetical protein [Portunus trituberculatus]
MMRRRGEGKREEKEKREGGRPYQLFTSTHALPQPCPSFTLALSTTITPTDRTASPPYTAQSSTRTGLNDTTITSTNRTQRHHHITAQSSTRTGLNDTT